MYVFHDCHVHLTDYVQKGPDLRQFLSVMGNTVGRSTLFGIPLQQKWSYRISGNEAPTYYLQTDAPLYYYSIDWVEKGKAPDSLLASKVTDNKVVRTRPLCPYPQVARYKGQGSIDEAANFSCVAPK